jgi:hypothetical protein
MHRLLNLVLNFPFGLDYTLILALQKNITFTLFFSYFEDLTHKERQFFVRQLKVKASRC